MTKCEQCDKATDRSDLIQVTYAGDVRWQGIFCTRCVDEFWGKFKSQVNAIPAEVSFMPVPEQRTSPPIKSE